MYTNEKYAPLIEDLYREIIALGEPLTLKSEHSPKWQKTFNKFCNTSLVVAARTWPEKTCGANKKIPLNPESTDQQILQAMIYTGSKNTFISILSHYDPSREVTFWQYFNALLKRNIEKEYAIYKRTAENNSVIHVSRRKGVKIRNLLKLLNAEKKRTGNKDLTLESSEMRQILEDSHICKDAKELDKLIKLEKDSHLTHLSSNEETFTNMEDTQGYIYDQLAEDIPYLLDTLNQFAQHMETCFNNKMSLKKQPTNTQDKKETFMQEILTCYYLDRFIAKFDMIQPEEIFAIFENRNFTSKKILDLYKAREAQIQTVIQSATTRQEKIDASKKITVIRKASPTTLAKISESHKTAYNYGTMRKNNFKKFLLAHLQQQNADPIFTQLAEIK